VSGVADSALFLLSEGASSAMSVLPFFPLPLALAAISKAKAFPFPLPRVMRGIQQ
jgi:hypothetical protein